MIIIELLFWISTFLIFHTLFFYLFIQLVRKKKKYRVDSEYLPEITLIISAYNEEKIIAEKLANTKELDYPKEKLQVIVVNDGSTDKTSEIAKYLGFETLDLPRSGKTNGQNKAVQIAQNEILVFSDANSIYKNDSLKILGRNFADDRVGAVCGELKYTDSQSIENKYWNYEILLKKAEGQLGQLVGANGSIYAVRKSSYSELPPDSISDLLEPLFVYNKGLDVKYEPQAISIEEVPTNIFKRKKRIILRSLFSIKYLLPLLNPFQARSIFFPFISHKLIRWFLPYLAVIAYVLSIKLYSHSVIYSSIVWFQTMVYMGMMIHPRLRYFAIVNLASATAVIDWLRGKKKVTWEVER